MFSPPANRCRWAWCEASEVDLVTDLVLLNRGQKEGMKMKLAPTIFPTTRAERHVHLYVQFNMQEVQYTTDLYWNRDSNLSSSGHEPESLRLRHRDFLKDRLKSSRHFNQNLSLVFRKRRLVHGT
ncbi:hypothetical protein AVEN_114473-1 [Araneus ventricosus]|uniref:Uncharacterized protein n=1 Tax=Araneus ventricosus TaxID=182803 RepID=A0A4Y2I4A6_ARAVE|nr:hypothetical protein AVEN_114473-1 [Araneus ventricosus]